VRIEGRVYATSFDDPRLQDSVSERGSLDFGLQVSDRGSLRAAYAVEFAELETSYVTHFGSFQWSQVVSARSALLLEGGTSYTDQTAAAGLPASWNFYGGASFAREVGRSRVVLFARREVIPVFGVGGLRLSDRFGLSAEVPLGRLWQMGLSGSYVSRRSPEGFEGDDASGTEASFSLNRSLGRRLAIGAEGRYRRRGPDGSLPAIEGLQATVALTLASARGGGT
jgi:hypothetical protein